MARDALSYQDLLFDPLDGRIQKNTLLQVIDE